jgi:hypothetical protein
MTARFLSLLFIILCTASGLAAQSELRFALRSEPRTFNPALVEDEASEVMRYLC